MKYPTPVGGYLEVVGRLLDVVFGALAQAIPQRTPAASFGTTGVTTVAGRHPRTGRYFVSVFPYPGGYGAYNGGDGLVHGVTPQSMANFMSIEMSEHRYPVRFRHFALREDSGGAGKFRGGCGTTYSFEPWSDVLVSVLGDRVDHVPFGVAGGKSAAPNEVKYRSGNEEFVPPLRSKYEKQPLKAGDLVMNSSPGGGGFGNPLERALESVELDLNLGYISRQTAERDYGAVIAEAKSRRRAYALSPRYRGEREPGATARQKIRERTRECSRQQRRMGAAARIPPDAGRRRGASCASAWCRPRSRCRMMPTRCRRTC